MNEKIEINTMITKHENRYKDCRFDFFDVFEEKKYLGMVQRDSTKIVDRLNEQQLVISKLDEHNTGYMVGNLTLKKENNQLKEENEQLKQEIIIYKKAFQQQVQRCTL